MSFDGPVMIQMAVGKFVVTLGSPEAAYEERGRLLRENIVMRTALKEHGAQIIENGVPV